MSYVGKTRGRLETRLVDVDFSRDEEDGLDSLVHGVGVGMGSREGDRESFKSRRGRLHLRPNVIPFVDFRG
jgi:hypothetical protein